jgi:hypothetical protein
MNTNSGQLSIGATLRVTDSMAVDLALADDTLIDTAPDVVFHLAWHWRVN